MLKNINTQEYWNDIYTYEKENPWRINLVGFSKISAVIGSGKTVLDVGCGKGILLDKLKANGNETFGLDISDVVIDYINQRGHKGIAQDVKVDYLGKFDYIILSHILEHLDNDKEVVNKFSKMGKLIGVVPFNCISSEEEMTHTRVYTKESLRELLGECFIEEFQEHLTNGQTGFKALFFKTEK